MNLPFEVIVCVFVVLFLLILSLAFVLVQRKKREEKLLRIGILYLNSLRNLLIHIQQQSGLSEGKQLGYSQPNLDMNGFEVLVKREIADVDAILMSLLTLIKNERVY